MRQGNSSNLAYLNEVLSSLSDDPLKHWSSYPCIEWPSYKDVAGYGSVYIPVNQRRSKRRGDREMWVHRLALEFSLKRLLKPHPEELACHHCDNPSCFRPIHLFPGTYMDNWKDAVRKGRQKSHTPVEFLRGEKNNRARLTADEVLEIRRLCEGEDKPKGFYSSVARQFGIFKEHLHAIRTRKCWKHI